MNGRSILAGLALTVVVVGSLAVAIRMPLPERPSAPPAPAEGGVAPSQHARPVPPGSFKKRPDPLPEPAPFVGLGGTSYTRHAAKPVPLQTIEIRIEPTFTDPEQALILGAVREWNYVLNGHVRLTVGTWAPMTAPLLVAAAAAQDAAPVWTVQRIDRSYNPQGQSRPMAVTQTLYLPAASIVVFVDRLRDMRLDRVMLHEFGHALGLDHDPRGRLMQEKYSGNDQVCIDRAAVEDLARQRGIPVAELNWCTY